jgi:hypothetical protein
MSVDGWSLLNKLYGLQKVNFYEAKKANNTDLGGKPKKQQSFPINCKPTTDPIFHFSENG